MNTLKDMNIVLNPQAGKPKGTPIWNNKNNIGKKRYTKDDKKLEKTRRINKEKCLGVKKNHEIIVIFRY